MSTDLMFQGIIELSGVSVLFAFFLQSERQTLRFDAALTKIQSHGGETGINGGGFCYSNRCSAASAESKVTAGYSEYE